MRTVRLTNVIADTAHFTLDEKVLRIQIDKDYNQTTVFMITLTDEERRELIRLLSNDTPQ